MTLAAISALLAAAALAVAEIMAHRRERTLAE
jgi:hypothetical protein